MRKIIYLFFILLTAVSSHAQFTITAVKGQYSRHEHSFPYIRSVNKNAADKINLHLQMELLGNDTVKSNARKIFVNSVFKNNESKHLSGLTQINYEVVLNDGLILSLKFYMETLGAYPESYFKYYSFHAQSGEPVLAKDIFTTEGITWLKKYLVEERAKRIIKYISERDYEAEDSTMVRERYAECNEDPQEDFLFIQPGSLRFYKEFCFPHAWRALDRDLDVQLPFNFVEKYVSAAGKKLLRY